MSTELPRVTYSNMGVDLSVVHDRLDTLVPLFEKNVLAQRHTTPYATGVELLITSPIDKHLLLGYFRKSTVQDVAAAIAAAKAAQAQWCAATWKSRIEFAKRWARALQEEKYNIALAALYEIGKSRMEAVGEAEEAVDLVEYYQSELERNDGYSRRMRELIHGETTYSILKPYGTFGVIAPFNFPVALSVNMIAGALLTGNTVVYKPSPLCALTATLIMRTIEKAGCPADVVTLLLGDADVGNALVESREIDGIAFTGSNQTGTAIYRKLAAGAHAKPVIADMGGKNPGYVTAKADIAMAAEGVARSAFGLQGQKCSACSVVYVERPIAERFIEALKTFAATLKVGDPRRRDTFMGPLYSGQTVRRMEEAIADARKGGTIIAGGARELVAGVEGNYYQPTIIQLPAAHRLTRDELFMPFVAIRVVDSLDDALREGNAVNYGLSTGIYSKDQAQINQFMAEAAAGVLYANRASGATTGAWPGAQPFCGWKGSGVSGKGGLGPHYLPQFMREQSQTVLVHNA